MGARRFDIRGETAAIGRCSVEANVRGYRDFYSTFVEYFIINGYAIRRHRLAARVTNVNRFKFRVSHR